MQAGRVWGVVAWLLASGCSAPQQLLSPSKPTPGCSVAVSRSTHNAYYEPLVIVAIHPNGTDYWVVYPQRDQRDFMGVDGRVRAVNVPISKILQQGEARIIDGVMCRCPSGSNIMEDR